MNSAPSLVPAEAASRGRGAGRVPFAFGRRFFLLLLIGLVWIGPAWFDRRFLYALVLWDALVSCLWIWDLRQLPPPGRIEVRRRWAAAPQLLAESTITLEIDPSCAPLEISGKIVDDVPVSLRDELPEMDFSISRGERGSVSYAIRPRERGDSRVGDIAVRYQSPWHLAERWAYFATTQAVRIYPNLEEAKRDALHLIRSRQITVERRLQNRRGQGREFESLREYRERDEFRDMCWTATARRGKLISKSYQIERSQAVWLILDTGRLLRARLQGLSNLDYAVSAVLALVQVALYSGDRVGLLAYGRKIRLRLPVARGPSHMRAILEGLAQLGSEESEADHVRAAESLLALQKRRSLVIWLTDLAETAATPEVIESAIRLSHRHLTLFAVMGHADLRDLVERRPQSDRDMFRYAAGQEIIHRRDLLLRTLRQQGALALELEPGRLSSALVNHYLDVKERNLI